MEKNKAPHRKHVFICCNTKKDGTGCDTLGGGILRERTKKLALEKGMADVRINKSGCLDCCNDGIAAVIYPDGNVYTRLTADDAEALLKEID